MSTDGEKHAHLFVFSADKAGMTTVDKSKQSKIIYDMSKNSSFFKQAMVQDSKTDEKIAVMKDKLNKANDTELFNLKTKVESELLQLESSRNLNRVCVVLDMDMFYAAVEIRDNPGVKDMPVAVGGNEMICTANYVARTYGVRAAMPGFIAKKLCPNLVFISPNFEKYTLVSEQIKEIIQEYDENFTSYSLDEVYFDITKLVTAQLKKDSDSPNVSSSSTSTTNLNESSLKQSISESIVHEIRSKIFSITNGLTCSAGIANNFLLAKICADINKPNGLYYLPATRNTILDFMSKLPCRKIPGIGKVLEKILNSFELFTMADVRMNLHKLYYVCTTSTKYFLLRVSIGIDDNEISSTANNSSATSLPTGTTTRKSLSVSRSFTPISSTEAIKAKLLEICSMVNADLIAEKLYGKLVTLKLKTSEFELVTKCTSSTTYIQATDQLYQLALNLLTPLLPAKLRLIGVSISKFKNSFDTSTLSRNQQLLEKYIPSHTSSNSSAISSTNSSSVVPSDVIEIIDVDQECTSSLMTSINENSDDYRCPICNCCLNSKSSFAINDHIDMCLSRYNKSENSHSYDSGNMIENRSTKSSGTIESSLRPLSSPPGKKRVADEVQKSNGILKYFRADS